jgi:ubiquinone/menaquinone biosynthesis C-methylase UbiE
LGSVDELFQGGELLIDLGCGDGRWLDEIGPRYRTAVGVDVNRGPIDQRVTGPVGWQFIEADLDVGLPFADAVADAIHANQVIEHLREPGLMLREARRILRPGGL